MKTDQFILTQTKYLLLFFSFIVLAQLLFIISVKHYEYLSIIAVGAVITGCLHYMLSRNFMLTFLIPIMISTSHFYLISLFLIEHKLIFIYFLLLPIILAVLFKHTVLSMSLLLITTIECIVIVRYVQLTVQPMNNASLLIFTTVIIGMLVLLLFTFKVRSTELSILFKDQLPESTSTSGYLDLFFEYAQDAIAVFAIDMKILAVNPAFEELYLWKKEDCIGKRITLYHPSDEDNVTERIQLLLEGRHFKNLRTKEIRKDGTMFEAATTLAPIKDKNNNVIAISVIVRDMTERIQVERIKMEAIKLNAIGEMAASVAHEVRNPMTSINGFVQMMNNDPANPYRAFSEIMENEIKRINLIANEFLILSKPNIKERKQIDVEHLIMEVISHLEHELIAKDIGCDIYLAEYQTTVIGNEESLKQVFINLIRNAIDANPNKGSISFTNTILNDILTITIRDTGSGFHQETLDQLFTPFFTTKDGAAGLGLVISKKIILDHDGTIEINERAKQGAEITITLPISSFSKQDYTYTTTR
ncbi:ATP-binding protein [Sporosarcina sp. OR05]|uniref:ATP-binding protein n=1 Tax=Sporosarcina sp. OR05 TaxID=2969819 RepID=UPI00352B9E57